MKPTYGRVSYAFNTFLFLLPWLVVFGVFSVFPILYSVYLSFTEYIATSTAPPQWVGLENYIGLFSDERFLKSLLNSFVFMLGTVPLTIALAVVTAVLMNRNIRFRAFYRVAVFVPLVTSLFVIAIVFSEIYAPKGLANDLLGIFGIKPIHWLRDPNWAFPAIMIMSVWGSFGFYSLVILAALQAIPNEYYEAALLEGAGRFRCFWKITLPLIKPTILFSFILNSILAFQVFGEIYIMTQGGPLGSTETSVFYIYNLGFSKREMGYASAAAYVVFCCLAVFSIMQMRFSKKRKIQYV